MAKERGFNEFFPASKRSKTELSAADNNAREEYVYVDTKLAKLGKDAILTSSQANEYLSRLENSFNKSSKDQWFHFAAKKLFLNIIRKMPNRFELDQAYQLTTEQLRDKYSELQCSALFTKRSNAEQDQIKSIIANLNEKIARDIKLEHEITEPVNDPDGTSIIRSYVLFK